MHTGTCDVPSLIFTWHKAICAVDTKQEAEKTWKKFQELWHGKKKGGNRGVNGETHRTWHKMHRCSLQEWTCPGDPVPASSIPCAPMEKEEVFLQLWDRAGSSQHKNRVGIVKAAGWTLHLAMKRIVSSKFSWWFFFFLGTNKVCA